MTLVADTTKQLTNFKGFLMGGKRLSENFRGALVSRSMQLSGLFARLLDCSYGSGGLSGGSSLAGLVGLAGLVAAAAAVVVVVSLLIELLQTY